MMKFQNVLRLCGGRKVLLDNRTTDKDKKAKQLNQLLAHVKDVAKQTGGIPYTDNMHRKIKVCLMCIQCRLMFALYDDNFMNYFLFSSFGLKL